jgi:hypothetical protein
MRTARRISKELVLEARTIEAVLQCAVRDALRAHKLAGNTVASWEDGRVVLIPAEDIPVEANDDNAQPSSRATETSELSR